MEAKLREYARLLIEVGLNVQKGQTLLIRTPVQNIDFAHYCMEAAYDVGCREVLMEYRDGEAIRMKYLRADDAIFDEYPDWMADKMNTLARENTAFLSIYAEDPDMLKGVDPSRIQRASRASGQKTEEYNGIMMANKARWCVASVSIAKWAAKVFPDKAEQEAVDALWDAIFETLRITGDGKAVQRWQAHTDTIHARAEKLNAMNLESLHYTNSIGTDLVIGIPEGAIWSGGAEIAGDGVPFVANMPTEEIFTAPHREKVNGRVVSSMPFVLNGNVIERFAFTFKDGKIVEIEAGTEEERKMLESDTTVDEGASYLGEVALVPYDSPISNLRILFYNTLFDENASCHLAFGKAYPSSIQGGDEMDKEALLAHGMNDSFTHQDFMVGTKDLSITGTTRDGQQVVIFENGNFAF